MMFKYIWTVCRVCLKESDEMCSIFDKDDTEIVIANKIEDCAGVTILQGANLPEQICKKCLAFLSVSHKFRITCRNSDETLHKFATKDIEPDEEEDFDESFDIIKEEENPDDVVAIDWEPAESEFESVDIKMENNKDITPAKATSIPRTPVNTKSKKESKLILDLEADGTPVIITQLSKDRQSYVCDICGNIYKSRSALESHVRWHRQEKPFKCEICGMTFGLNQQIVRHMRKHTGEKPYMCQYCGRRFSDSGTKQKHERTHTGERPYSCEVCGKTFTYSHVLRAHELIHTGEKQFSCDECGKRFTRAHHLKAHLNTMIHQDPGIAKKQSTAATKQPDHGSDWMPTAHCTDDVSCTNLAPSVTTLELIL